MLRLNKKGITHVDWAISMGIFIIYVSFLIIFIMPSLLKTQFDPSTLFDSFEKNFLEPIEWTVVKIPLTIVNLKNTVQVGGSPQVVRLVFEITGEEHRFTKIEPVTSNDLQTYDGTDNPTMPPNELKFSDANKVKIIFGCIPLECNNINLKFSVAPLETKKHSEFALNCNVGDENDCKASLGIEEEIKGIKEKPFTPIPNDEFASFFDFKDVVGSGSSFSGYTTLKDTLKFSDNVNFDIWYIEGANKWSIFDQGVFNNPEEKPPTVPENANVFIKEFKRFYVNEFGDLKPVVFYFETW